MRRPIGAKILFFLLLSLTLALSCHAFKLHIEGGRDTPQDGELFFDLQFKCTTAYLPMSKNHSSWEWEYKNILVALQHPSERSADTVVFGVDCMVNIG
ncbi:MULTISPECIES: hypothetical protein [unclassified Microcoleus]|uniref:hypothetical protein n=1 Tax=unclassified Microcoleus TaxID=2642155 RepID=UPI002FCECB88